jgi:hypothetical protein
MLYAIRALVFCKLVSFPATAQSLDFCAATCSAAYCSYLQEAMTQGDQNVSLHLMITIQLSGAQRLFDHPV